MSRSTRGDKEYSRLQEALHENKKLKRENASLRKQLARLDLDRHSYVREIVEEHMANEESEKSENDSEKLLNDLKEAWACKECNDGYLEIILYGKLEETWYFRKCSNPNCGNRTKSQIYSPTIRGIIKNGKR